MRPWFRRPISLAVALLPSLATGQAEASPKIEKFTFAGKTLGGQQLDQTQFTDSILIVDLWGTWCPPCRKAVPALVKLYEQYKHHGLEIVGFCYANDGTAEDADRVRKFAAENRLTYPLLPGDAAVRDQVPGFKGYPTLLLFGRGLTHERTQVGFDEQFEQGLEAWVRKSLAGAAAVPAADAKEEVPPGRLFEPGNGDRGFELETEDVHGASFSFAALQGSRVLMAITTSWDQEAARTARFLEAMRKDNADLRVVAWHLERDRDAAKKNEAVRTFLAAQGVGYVAFATELAAVRDKVHRFASMPTLLLFDKDGTLILREGGISEAVEQRIRDRVREQAQGR